MIQGYKEFPTNIKEVRYLEAYAMAGITESFARLYVMFVIVAVEVVGDVLRIKKEPFVRYSDANLERREVIRLNKLWWMMK